MAGKQKWNAGDPVRSWVFRTICGTRNFSVGSLVGIFDRTHFVFVVLMSPDERVVGNFRAWFCGQSL